MRTLGIKTHDLIKSSSMRYQLRTLMLLMAIAPPLIGFWPSIKRRAVARATQVTASDVVVAAAAATLILIRISVDDRAEIGLSLKS